MEMWGGWNKVLNSGPNMEIPLENGLENVQKSQIHNFLFTDRVHQLKLDQGTLNRVDPLKLDFYQWTTKNLPDKQWITMKKKSKKRWKTMIWKMMITDKTPMNKDEKHDAHDEKWWKAMKTNKKRWKRWKNNERNEQQGKKWKKNNEKMMKK